jgi:hypothetical protein
MSSRTRSQAFDQALSLAGVGSVCTECGQAPSASGVGVVVVEDVDDLHECEGCGHWLDADGQLLGQLVNSGGVILKRIVIPGGLPHIRAAEPQEAD